MKLNTYSFNFNDEIQAKFDLNSFFKSLVVDVFTNNWDSYHVNGRNFYLYENPKDNKFYWIPYQTASMYFQKYGKAPKHQLFVTSDFDLSEFTAHKYGVAFKFKPVFDTRIFKSKKRTFNFDFVELRSGIYDRSNGLQAFFVSIGLAFKFDSVEKSIK